MGGEHCCLRKERGKEGKSIPTQIKNKWQWTFSVHSAPHVVFMFYLSARWRGHKLSSPSGWTHNESGFSLPMCERKKKTADVTPVTKLNGAWDVGLCVSHQDLMSGLSFRSHIYSTLDHNIHVEEIIENTRLHGQPGDKAKKHTMSVLLTGHPSTSLSTSNMCICPSVFLLSSLMWLHVRGIFIHQNHIETWILILDDDRARDYNY